MLICVFLFDDTKMTFHLTHISNIIKTVSFFFFFFKKHPLIKISSICVLFYFTIYFLFRSILRSIITIGTLCSRTPRWSRSPRKRTIHRSTWSWSSVSGSWWGRSTGPSGRREDTPPGGFYWWRCSFYDPCDAWGAREPSLLGTSALCGGGDRGQAIR